MGPLLRLFVADRTDRGSDSIIHELLDLSFDQWYDFIYVNKYNEIK